MILLPRGACLDSMESDKPKLRDSARCTLHGSRVMMSFVDRRRST
ncbi:hypothetical protein JMJ77_0011483, partial [Colletotrichum scovillei]